MWPAALDPELAATYCSISVSTLEALVRDKDCPPPRQISKRRAVYLKSELDAWLLTRPVSSMLPPPSKRATA